MGSGSLCCRAAENRGPLPNSRHWRTREIGEVNRRKRWIRLGRRPFRGGGPLGTPGFRLPQNHVLRRSFGSPAPFVAYKFTASPESSSISSQPSSEILLPLFDCISSAKRWTMLAVTSSPSPSDAHEVFSPHHSNSLETHATLR